MHRLVLLCFALITLHGGVDAQTWRELTPSEGPAPTPRFNASAIYDPVQHRMVVFAGRTSSGDRNDVWAFDLESNTWTDITPAEGPAPRVRSTQNAVYDPENRSMIIWSGQILDGGREFLNDIWAFDLEAHTWSQFQPPDPMPNIRYGTAAVFDPRDRALVTFAGFTDDGRFDDTWSFAPNQDQWTDISPSTGHPLRRCLHNGVYDRREHRFLIYGGQNSGNGLQDLWAFDLEGNNWTELTPDETPDGRWFAATVYDDINHRFLMFGGEKDQGQGNSDELWAFDLTANTWLPLTAEGATPGQRSRSVAIYIESEHRMVLYGGAEGRALGDVWSLEGLTRPTAVEGAQNAQPNEFTLAQNYPNPFNSATSIDYTLKQGQDVVLGIYNLNGQRVATIVDEYQRAGTYQATWNGINNKGQEVTSGVYLYRLEGNNNTQTNKLLLLK